MEENRDDWGGERGDLVRAGTEQRSKDLSNPHSEAGSKNPRRKRKQRTDFPRGHASTGLPQ